MSEHGILMKDEMVRALLRPPGDPLHKTVTRRTSDQWARRKVGDLLWVRECFAPTEDSGAVIYRADCEPGTKAADVCPFGRWTPGIHMRRDQSRILLRVTDLRRERADECRNTRNETFEDRVRCALNHCPNRTGCRRLPAVDDAEARREGVEDRVAYLRLFEEINGDAYPTWVWRIAFEEVTRG